MQQTLAAAGINFDWTFTLTFGGLILARIIVITTTIPFLVGKPVPNQIKIGLALSLVVFLYPYLMPLDRSVIPRAPLMLFLLFVKEAGIGFVIGMAAAIVFHGFEAAGSVIDNQRGAAQARLLIPQLGEQSSLFGNFEYLLGITLFLAIDGHILFFKSLVESYDYLPLLTFPTGRPDMVAMVGEFIKLSGKVLILAVQLSAPILISIFVADLILGIMSKTAPSINVWELGFVVRGVLGVAIFFLAFGLIVSQMEKVSLSMIPEVERLLRLLSVPATPA